MDRLLSPPRRRQVCLDVLFLSLDCLAIHFFQHTQAEFNIANENITPATGEILSNHHTKHLHLVRVWRHGVGRDNPSAGSKVVSQREFVIVSFFASAFLGTGEAEGDEWKALSGALRHDDEPELLERVTEIIGRAGQVAHDGPIAYLAETDQLVVLANDLRCPLGEVEGKR